MIEVLCAILAMAIVAVILLTAIIGWGARVTRCQKIGLCVCASGLILATPHRVEQGVTFADLVFLSGLFVYLLARNLKFILRRADALDGAEDGRLSLPPTPQLIARVRAIGNPTRR